MNNYDNYFKDHYRYGFSAEDVRAYGRWFWAQWRFFNKKIKVDYKKNILEIGSGIGGFYDFFRTDNYVGIELDKAAVEFANNHFRHGRFRNISLEAVGGAEKFDYVFAFEVLEHLDNPQAAAGKIAKLLDENGVFIGTTPYPFKKNIVADNTHLSVLHPENWRRLFLQAGFRSVDLHPLTFIPFLWRINKYFNIRLPFYLPFKYFISTCLIIAKK